MRISDWSSDVCSSDLVARDRPVPRPERTAPTPRSPLQPHGPAVDRSGPDDSDADRRLLLRHPFRASAVRRSAFEPSVPLVLPPWPGGCDNRPLDVLEEPSWQIGRAHVCTAVTNAHLVCRYLLEK